MIDRPIRECDGCTACCEGWAVGEAHGHKFYPGRKCFFVGDKGCTIYKDRPHEPCVTFKCQWLTNPEIPEWMKPNKSNVIIVEETVNGTTFLTVKETGVKLDSAVLSWLITAYQEGKIINTRYELNGGWNFIGTPEFTSLMSGKSPVPQLKKKQL